MTANEHRELAIRALKNSRGDDLARAEHAFRLCSPAELDQEYGQSGRTRQQILDDYRQHAERVDAAIRWVETRAD